jgi:GNAT superfamily N-acetyltransferase
VPLAGDIRVSSPAADPEVALVQATTPQQIADAADLMRGFIAWSREFQADNLTLLDQYFDAAAYERSLTKLPGYFGPPGGSLVVAYIGGQPAGCVAMRPLGQGVCEMKRMFIADGFRGHGLGRKLADRIIADAKAAGYERMRLETSVRQTDAIRLYERSGFHRIPTYNPTPPEMEGWLLAFELGL